MKRIKVLYIVHSSVNGGATTAIINLLESLSDRVEPLIITPSCGPLTDKLKQIGIQYTIVKLEPNCYPSMITKGTPIRFSRRLYYNYKAKGKIQKIIEQFNPDIIHTNTGVITVGYHLAKKNQIPHIWHLREFLDLDFGYKPYPSWSTHLQKYRDSETNHCITITKAVTSHFGLTDNVTQIYDGVIGNAPTEKKDKENYFLFAGRLQDAKGIIPLLEAYVKYCNEGGKTALKLAGTGSKSKIEECKRILSKCVNTGIVDFLGHRDDVYDLMSKAKALFVPSRFEGFGFITVEAMYNHCLVVGRNTGGTKEQFDNGLAYTGQEIGIRFNDDSDIKDIMHDIDRNDYADMIGRGYQTVINHYTTKIHSDKVYNLYQSIMKDNDKTDRI